MNKLKQKINKFAKTHSIKTTYIVSIVIFTVIPCLLLLGIIYSLSLSTIINEYSKSYISAVNIEYENRLRSVLNHLNGFMLNLSTHQELYTLILDEQLSDYEKTELVTKELRNFLNNEETVAGVEIKTDTSEYVFFKGNVNILNRGENISERLDKSKLYIDRNCIAENNEYYFRIGKKFFNFYSGYKVGDIILYVKEDVLQSIYSDSLLADDNAFIKVEDTVVSHTDKTQVGKRIQNERDLLDCLKIDVANEHKYLINTYSVDKRFLKSNVEMVSAISHERVIRYISEFVGKIFVATFLFMVVSILFAIKLSKNLTRNLRELIIRMKDFKKNIVTDKVFKRKKQHFNEITRLEESFETMLEEIKLLIVANEENSEKRRIAELNALQAQINPHFLYNVLDVISWLAKMEHQNLIEKMVTALSNFYRMGLHNGQNEIPIRDEIEHVKSYLFLQKVRFPDSFYAEFDVDERMLDSKIIKIVLQPLVENSIKHGFKKMTNGGVIHIQGKILNNEYYEFTITDNGGGIASNPLNSEDTKNKGYGIKNVNERLVMAYGTECGLQYRDLNGKGTEVSFKFKPIYDEDLNGEGQEK